jgi:hypothetical protein
LWSSTCFDVGYCNGSGGGVGEGGKRWWKGGGEGEGRGAARVAVSGGRNRWCVCMRNGEVSENKTDRSQSLFVSATENRGKTDTSETRGDGRLLSTALVIGERNLIEW